MSTAASFVGWLGVAREYLARRPGMEVASVGVVAYGSEPRVTVQMNCSGLPAVAGALLGWSELMAGVDVTAWRAVDDWVHLSVVGRVGDGSAVRVYGGVPFTVEVFGDLQVDGEQGVSLAVLRTWAAA